VRKALISVQAAPTGSLIEHERGRRYTFTYLADYDGPPVSLAMPVPQMGQYSDQGLRSLDRRLRDLRPLEFTSEELVEEATRRASRMSIQGVQPKLSVVVDARQGKFTIVDTNGRYILKPPHTVFRSLPENEDLTMKLARAVGIEVPFHGMVYGKDSSLSYFIRRFDRAETVPLRIPVEDFAQLSGRTRDTKYDSSVTRICISRNTH